MIKIGNVFAGYLPSTEKSEATEGQAWFWIAVTLSCVPWVALFAWLIWR
ncbi:MAG TPA: hypothetical protein VGU20_02670 [Stellaceae bacterium]|nr:hypothetical protein [Stellaceae bacterium]